MAYQGPSYGLSRECLLKSQSKFDMKLGLQALQWMRVITSLPLEALNPEVGFRDQFDFADCLKDGIALCTLINILRPGSVSKINETKAPFKQRENLEMFLKGCELYGLKGHDLFQVNDLYERKNLYMVVNCLFALGGLAQKNHFNGPVIGVKVANQNKRGFTKEVLNKGESVIGLQSGTNKGANQSGMTPYGTTRQIYMADYR
ncbi:calponin-3-like [Oppia nitens]|uniref:calponin-3-like n=1 Tax=Oppia nitens TaxID=1686743 RepID=UPI0023DB91EE|nr:calponin-3-like [Oppia nitens]